MSLLLTSVALFARILILSPMELAPRGFQYFRNLFRVLTKNPETVPEIAEEVYDLKFCTSINRFYEIHQCTSSLSRCNRSLTNDWPQNPKEFLAHVKETFDKEMVFDLSWKSSSKNLQCIQILILRNGIPDICKILNFMVKNETFEDKVFTLEIPLTVYNADYLIEASSLPQWNSESVSWNGSLYDCSKWFTDFKHIYDGDQINVTFVQGPDRCDFRNYSVTLYDNQSHMVSKKIVYEKVNGTNLTAVFSQHLCKGEYYIEIRKAQEPRRDGCRRVDGKYRMCNGKKSLFQIYIPRISCDKGPIFAKPVPEKEEFHIIVIIGLVCILSIIASVLLIIYIFKRQQCQPRKRGLILFVDDYPAHTKAVLKLVDYLRECCFDIHLASHYLRHNEDRDQLIILSEALKSDFVLLVISSAFQKRMEAWDKQQDYVEFFQDRNSNVLTRWFLEKLSLWNRLYLCKFDHVSDCHSWSGRCYSLPSHLTEMVKDLIGDGFKLSFLTHHQRKALSEQLDNAVRKAACYEYSNSNWFHQKYFYPIAILMEENCFSEYSSSWK